eukprot:TRINITY_DN2651_c0_g1_i2.p1 TRINITY_DN2651_c0_g1~~TRINITY_DN2651_c0_g1_i2.p1  ORF type:complete len:156 (+),score=18.08 TRINITY_DN2651_c0_g1_i2:581-1048(+)
MISETLSTPVLHIADCTALRILANNQTKVGFIGTRFTMKETYLTDRIRAHGIQVLVPQSQQDLSDVQTVIEEKLSLNIFDQESKQVMLTVIQKLIQEGAEGIVLGCTEIPLLIKPGDVPNIPLYDSASIHIAAAVDVQLGCKKVTDFYPSGSCSC